MKIIRLGYWKLEDDIHLCTCVSTSMRHRRTGARSPNMVWQIVDEHISADSLGYHKHKTDHKTKRLYSVYSGQDTTGSQMKEKKDKNEEKRRVFLFHH